MIYTMPFGFGRVPTTCQYFANGSSRDLGNYFVCVYPKDFWFLICSMSTSFNPRALVLCSYILWLWVEGSVPVVTMAAEGFTCQLTECSSSSSGGSVFLFTLSSRSHKSRQRIHLLSDFPLSPPLTLACSYDLGPGFLAQQCDREGGDMY